MLQLPLFLFLVAVDVDVGRQIIRAVYVFFFLVCCHLILISLFFNLWCHNTHNLLIRKARPAIAQIKVEAHNSISL